MITGNNSPHNFIKTNIKSLTNSNSNSNKVVIKRYMFGSENKSTGNNQEKNQIKKNLIIQNLQKILN